MTADIQTVSLIDTDWVRPQFPALQVEQDGAQVLYMDNPAGTQVPQRTIDAIANYLMSANANTHGAFLTSRRTDAVIAAAREAMAAFVGAASPNEIAFGPNMTTITYNLSRAISRLLSPGDEIIVTDLDHDANITPWTSLQERGIVIRNAPVNIEDCTLDLDGLAALVSPKTRLIAVTYASNAVGSISDIPRIRDLAHSVGAWVWVDAVHYGPHAPIDVQALDVDFLVCSSYKFFGPHLGILWGRADLLEQIPEYQLRPAPHTVPEKFETGTKNHECLAGLVGTINYLADLGRRAAGLPEGQGDLRTALISAMTSVRAYELTLGAALLEGISSVPGVRIYGITDPTHLDRRVPTFAFTLEGISSPEVQRLLGERGIFTWSGNYYALAIMQRLGLEERGGAVRVGAVHYNTLDEIDRLVEALKAIHNN
jgi:cysteine desulfurase family protein (TIGR01976 family)